MKKILLAVTTLFLFSAVYAQTSRVDARRNALSTVAKNVQLTGFEEGAIPQTISPITRATSRNFVGMTYYDLQTNGSMAPRIIAHSDGTISAIWTTNDGQTLSHRGTGYNYYDGTSWINSSSSTDRIENTRTGWGTITMVGDAEIIASHNGSNALVIGVRPQKGTGDWTFSTLQGPVVQDIHSSATSTCLLWPQLASVGNTIHLIACTESDTGFLYRGIQTCLLYYRGTFNSSTNTITWEEPRIVGEVTSSEIKSFQGDGYAIAAKGNTVAIVAAPGMTKNPFIWKSTDNGVNFNKTTFFETAPAGDTAYRSDGSVAIAIDDNGTVHVAMGTYWCYIESENASTYTWYPGVGYLLYWNENQRVISYNGSQTDADPEVLRQNGNTVFERFNLDCDTSIWGISSWGVDAYPSYGVGTVSFPQLITDNGKVYLVFCELMEFPFVDINSSMYFRGVFATKSLDNGNTFGDISWLSFNKDCYYLEQDGWSLFPLDSTTTYEDISAYIYNEGESVFPAVAPNIIDGKINMIWQQDYYAGSEIKEDNVGLCSNESSIYFLSIDADEIGVYNNTKEVCQGLWVDSTAINNRNISGMKMYPNPASESVNIAFSAINAENGVVSVMNLMGQTVYTNNVEVNEGYNLINVPVKNFNSGVYMVTLRTNTGISTQKLIVK